MVKLFVGNLSWNTDDVRLREAFSKFGATRATIVTDRETGRSRGFAFVEFDKDEDASRARSEMDGSMLDGRTIRVDTAQNKPRPSGGGGGYRDNSGYRNSGGGYHAGGYRPPEDSGYREARPAPERQWDNDKPRGGRWDDRSGRRKRDEDSSW